MLKIAELPNKTCVESATTKANRTDRVSAEGRSEGEFCHSTGAPATHLRYTSGL